jgi:hypothetical protein
MERSMIRDPTADATSEPSASHRERDAREPPRIVSSAIKEAGKQFSNSEAVGDDAVPGQFGPS